MASLAAALTVHAASNTFKEFIYNPGILKPVDSTLKVKVGDPAPDFTLPSLSGEKVTLSQFKGRKNVVLSFVPAAWTPVCSDQWPGYNIARSLFEDNNAILLGITVADFMIAGGILLFVIALVDLLTFEKKRMRQASDSVGPVPLGTPLMVGPAVLTTSLVLVNVYGLVTTFSAIVLNIILAGVVFYASDTLTKMLGLSGTRALSKIASLFLASIAVMMVRKGVFEIVANFVGQKML